MSMRAVNIILSYPNRADGATISGGSWLAALPASNMATREVWQVARSTNDDITSTRFTVDFTAARSVRCVALGNHNLSAAARVRVTLGTTSGGLDLYDSGWTAAWQMAFDSLVEWESATWWIGTAGDEYLRSPYPVLVVFSDTYQGRYLTVEVDDTANADGYVQFGRVFAGGSLQPAINASYGLQDSWRDLSTTDASESGSFWPTERRRLRGVSFVLEHLTLAEAAYIHEMQRLLGTVNEVLYVPYPTDIGESQRYGFVGRLSELSPVEWPYYNTRSTAFKIEEIG